MYIEKGSHNFYREFGIRLSRKKYHHYEYFIEFNFWKWFYAINWVKKIK